MTDGPTPPPRGTWIVAGLLAVLLLLGVQTALEAQRARDFAQQAQKDAQAAARSAEEARKAAERAAGEIAGLRSEFEVLATGVSAVERQVKELADRINFGGDPDNPFGVSQPVEAFTPELREALRKSAAAKGVTLLEDRVVFPGRVNQRQGALEFLAVFPNGKTHESVLVLTGAPGEDGSPPEGLGATLNSCLMALGLKPGTPLQILPGGRTLPSTGTPVHISVEWEEEGTTVRVRAEDLLWDRERNRSMEEGKFVYVGSFFDPQGEGYVPDLTGDAVACYSVATCVVDLSDSRAADDQIFVPCGPRIPPEGTRVRVTFSAAPIPPTRTWDAADPGKVDEGGGDDGGGK